MWKLVQVGILFVLAVVAGMLFGVQRNKEAAPEAPPAVAAALAPVEAPAAAPEPAPTAPEPIRSPEPPVTAAARPAPTAPAPRAPAPRSQPQRPVAAPQPAPAPPPVSAPNPAPNPTPAPNAVPAPNPVPAPETAAAPAPNLPPAAVIPPPAGSKTAARKDPNRQSRVVTLPAGMNLVVRLNRPLSTAQHQTGDSFTATLDEPIIVDKLIIADRGATVEGRIVEADRAGRVSGRSQLSVTLTNLHTDDGQNIQLATSRFDVQGEGQTGKTAKRAAIGAGVGAAIGAILGGGKGAAVGAGTGAGAGAGAEAMKRGEDATLRAESRLFFRLEQPLEIREKL